MATTSQAKQNITGIGMTKDFLSIATQNVKDSISVKNDLLKGNHLQTIVSMAEKIVESFANGGKVLICGNGGSAADAQHLAAELLIRLRPHVNRQALPAITLATDISSLTACGNDYSFEDIFSRPLAALGRKGDVLLGITTSGKSPNVIKAFKLAKTMGITTFGFLGCEGGPALEFCDDAVIVPSNITGRIQEGHITLGHILMELVEEMII